MKGIRSSKSDDKEFREGELRITYICTRKYIIPHIAFPIIRFKCDFVDFIIFSHKSPK